MAHEVNTPLAVISTYAQMLAKQVANDEQKSVLLDKIARQTFRASEIVNSLLNFSRTSTTDFGEVNLNKVIQETLSLLEHQLLKAGVRSRRSWIRTCGPIHGNAGKLQQVFLNLFLNARDAMDRGGVLEVRTWARRIGRARGRERHGQRHPARTPAQDLRSVLHHQSGAQGYGPWTGGDLRNHPGAWRLDRGIQPARGRRRVPPGTAAGGAGRGQEAAERRFTGARRLAATDVPN